MARKGKMYDKQIESTFLKETMTVKIYEPEQYNPLYENQIVIMQDGDDYFQLGRVATISDKMHDDYELSNTVFVGIHYIDRFDRLKKYHPEGEQFEAYKSFLMKEVVPLIKDICPLNPLGTTYALMGDSLAGTIALMTAMDAPEIFSKIVLQSPLVNDDVLAAASKATMIKDIEIYHSIGLEETNVETTNDGHVDFLTPNRALQEQLKQQVSNYTYKEIEGGNHTWKFWQNEMRTVFEKMFM